MCHNYLFLFWNKKSDHRNLTSKGKGHNSVLNRVKLSTGPQGIFLV